MECGIFLYEAQCGTANAVKTSELSARRTEARIKSQMPQPGIGKLLL